MEVISSLCETIKSMVHLVSKENATSPLQLNTRQCQLLARRASDALSVVEELQSKFHRPEVIEGGQIVTHNLTLAALELHRVLKDSEILIKDCCCDGQWLQVAINQGNLRETFAKLLYDIQWYMSVLCSANHDGSDGVLDRSACEGKLEIPEGFMLSSAAKQDRKSLRELLRASHVCDPEICKQSCLAIKLLEKLDAEEEGFDSSTNLSKSQSPIFLWVPWQDLKRGRSIGRGGFAEVRETTWLGQKYAIKIFHYGAFYLELFRREIAVMAGLDHPQVIRIVCCSENNRNLGIVMERMQKSLRNLLDELGQSIDGTHTVGGVSLIPIIHCVDLMLQTAEGVRYLHSKGLAHRDLKCDNILVQFADPQKIMDSSDDVSHSDDVHFSSDYVSPFIAKVADFGLTKMKRASTVHATVVGTTPWMAPELFWKEDTDVVEPRFHPFKMDAYSFGLVCYEILTGETPFREMLSNVPEKLSMKEFKARVKGGERPSLPAEIPIRLASLIQRCCDTDSRVRPDFSAICTELRYIKGLLLQGNSLALFEVPKIKGVQAQGPWGKSNYGVPFCDGLGTSIKQMKLMFYTAPFPDMSFIEVEYDVAGKSYISGHGNAEHGSHAKVIKIDGPREYITQIEGSYTNDRVLSRYVSSSKSSFLQPVFCTEQHLTSLTIHTNEKTHGPFGQEVGTKFKSGMGRIIGFYGRCDNGYITQLGCFITRAGD